MFREWAVEAAGQLAGTGSSRVREFDRNVIGGSERLARHSPITLCVANSALYADYARQV